MWMMLINSLIFILFLVAIGLGILTLLKKPPVWLKFIKNSTSHVNAEAAIKITERKFISTQHSLIEVEWRGASYLLHLTQNNATLLDRDLHEK